MQRGLAAAWAAIALSAALCASAGADTRPRVATVVSRTDCAPCCSLRARLVEMQQPIRTQRVGIEPRVPTPTVMYDRASPDNGQRVWAGEITTSSKAVIWLEYQPPRDR